jgi:CDP-diacylglycerol--serine O-phosphatidyltransferase
MKKIYILPNLITTANLTCGFLSMVHSVQGEYFKAAWFIIIGAICDSLDGRVARMARATSAFGVQYDSLSDLTSFGIAPAILAFTYGLRDIRIGVSAAALYAICAALRLARFNVSAEETNPSKLRKIRKGYFQGMPSPASAGLMVTAVLIQQEHAPFTPQVFRGFMLVLSLLLAGLMVSNVPFPSFKDVNWRAKGKAWILLIPVAFILSAIQEPEWTLFAVGYLYLVLGLAWAAYLCWFAEKRKGPQGDKKEEEPIGAH